MDFPLEKIFLSDEEIIPFERYNAQWHTKIRTNGVTLQYNLQTSEKPKMASLINVIINVYLV